LTEGLKLKDRPLISIITPSLNSVRFIAEAIESVVSQDYSDIEHIIIDGGSADGTLELLRTYPHVRVISEPDRGMYYALNKGIQMVQGEIIGQLNSDDFYEKNVFAEIAKLFTEHPTIDAIRGGATVLEDQADGSRRSVAQYVVPPGSGASFRDIVLGVPVINAYFFRSRVFKQYGLYNIFYTISADKDFLIRLALAGFQCSYLPRVVYHYRQHAGSLTINRQTVPWFKIRNEHLHMAERYLQTDQISPEIKSVFELWHKRESAEGALQALREVKPLKAIKYGFLGWRHNPWWPLAFFSYFFSKVAHLAMRRRNE